MVKPPRHPLAGKKKGHVFRTHHTLGWDTHTDITRQEEGGEGEQKKKNTNPMAKRRFSLAQGESLKKKKNKGQAC